jgi:sugar-specific transcriptional regulator TrmB
MVILLDIDGVLVTKPSWEKVESGPDGFMLFNKGSAENLAFILSETNASVVLTTTHRINFDLEKWIEIFASRGINISAISKLNNKNSLAEMHDRGTEIKEWVDSNRDQQDYVIIDDDTSINNLPSAIKNRWVATKPFIGIDDEAKERVLAILQNI